MANIELASGVVLQGDTYLDSARVARVPQGASYRVASITGTMTAALGANSMVWAMRVDPAPPAGVVAHVYRVRCQFTCIVAFTTPITAGRRLALFRGTGVTPGGGGGAITPIPKKYTGDPTSEADSASGGIVITSTTAALTGAPTFEAQPLAQTSLVHVGAAGAHIEWLWEFTPDEDGAPLVLTGGELLAIRNPVAMDAAGTWQLSVTVGWSEGALQ